MANKNLNVAKEAKKGEFYMQLADIENELKHCPSISEENHSLQLRRPL